MRRGEKRKERGEGGGREKVKDRMRGGTRREGGITFSETLKVLSHPLCGLQVQRKHIRVFY